MSLGVQTLRAAAKCVPGCALCSSSWDLESRWLRKACPDAFFVATARDGVDAECTPGRSRRRPAAGPDTLGPCALPS